MTRLIVLLLFTGQASAAGAQATLHVEVTTCDGDRFDTLPALLAVEMAATRFDSVGDGSADEAFFLETECGRPDRVTLTVHRFGRRASTTTDLADAHASVALRTLALLLVDLWRTLTAPPNDAEAAGREEGTAHETLSIELPGSPARAEPTLGRQLETPYRSAPAVRERVRTDPVQGAHRRDRTLWAVLAVGADSSVRFDGPTVVPGGRISVGLHHRGGFVGQLALSIHGLGSEDAAGAIDLLHSGLDLRGGWELRVDDVVIGLSAGVRAGFVALVLRHDGAPQTDVEVHGTVDVAATGLLRWQFHHIVGLQVEAGIGFALIGFDGSRASRASPQWHEGWVPVRAALAFVLP